MYVKREIDPEIIWYFSWRTFLFSGLLSGAVLFFYEYFGYRNIAVPFLPIATIGTAVAFYVGFKNNSAYDRLWEARKIWGELTNYSRAVVSYLLAVIRKKDQSETQDAARLFVYRQIAYVNLLRLQLRKRNVWDDSDLYTQLVSQCFPTKGFLYEAENALRKFCSPEETRALIGKNNIAKELVHQQMAELASLKSTNLIDAYEHSDMMRLCNELFVQQGKAERIKSFPFPRQYAFFSEVFVHIFMWLLPFGLIGEFAKLGDSAAWLTVPFSMMISWIFDTMEKVGDSSENPFENNLNDVPMTAICRNIEIDLLEMLGEMELPDAVREVDHILM